MGDWFSSMIRSFFFTIDHVIYGAIEKVYDLFETISTTTILTQPQIAQVADRIYDLLAIFMIFKVTLSLITYVVSPDSFNDKSSGIGSLVRNVVLVLALLVLTPYLFNYAFQLQGLILKDNIIPKLIFGDEQVNEEVYNAGENLTFITMSAFYYPDASVIPGCSELTDADGGAISQSCKEALDNKVSDTGEGTLTSTDVNNYVNGFANKSYGLTFRKSLVTAKTADDQYVIDYSYFLSTAVGIVILLIIISFCMDVAVRSIKLSFLQLVAPVPIISFIDPKGGKDGMFKKWYKMCFGTYLSLFIRLFVIYFAIYIIKLVGDANMYDVVSGATVTGLWLKVFIIIGALMFAKQLPKILENLGIKLDSNFQLNPFRKMEKQMLGGGLMKKPADLAAKGTKLALGGAALSAGIIGLKKGMAGIDAVRNGYGFREGTRRVPTKFTQNLDKYRPFTAESRKNKQTGREEISSMNNNWNEGRKKALSMKSFADSKGKKYGKVFDLLDGTDVNEDIYRNVFKNEEFIKAKMHNDKQSEIKKIYDQIFEARQLGSDYEKIYSNSDLISRMKKYGVDPEKLKDDGVLSEKRTKQGKILGGAESNFKSISKVYGDDARTDTQLTLVKNNETNPSNPSQNVAGELVQTQQTPMQQVSTQSSPQQQTPVPRVSTQSIPMQQPISTQNINMSLDSKEIANEVGKKVENIMSGETEKIVEATTKNGEFVAENMKNLRNKIQETSRQMDRAQTKEEFNRLSQERKNLQDRLDDLRRQE